MVHTPINLMGFGQGLLGGITSGKLGRTSTTNSNNYHIEEND